MGDIMNEQVTQMMATILPLAAMFLIMYFLLIKPQKKKDNEAKKLRSEVEIGDEIITIGGIVGRVVSIKEDNLLIETGGDRNKMRIRRWAIQTVQKIKMD